MQPRRPAAATRRRRVAPSTEIVRLVPRAALTPGAVVIAHVPYADGTGSKRRPAVVLRASRHDVEVLPVTSKPPRRRGGTALADWEPAGLRQPSTVRHTPVLIDRRDVDVALGQLSPRDHRTLVADGLLDTAPEAESSDDPLVQARELLGEDVSDDVAAAIVGALP